MKKHNFKEAMDIFKAMFDGWYLVTKEKERYELVGVDVFDNHVISQNQNFELDDISHLEQTKPMNGDEVWAWDDHKPHKRKAFYVGKTTKGMHIVECDKSAFHYDNVKLISPTRKFTIKEATEMLRGIVTEPFEIIKE